MHIYTQIFIYFCFELFFVFAQLDRVFGNTCRTQVEETLKYLTPMRRCVDWIRSFQSSLPEEE